jgi:inner membrane protein
MLALVVGTLIFSICRFHPLIFCIAFFSHLLFDMLTVGGVPLFYPFLKNICAIPGDRSKRFKTGDWKAESVSFSLFLLTGVTMQPLMTQGFWTTYNSQFGTQKHLASEFHKSKDLLEVEYLYTIGSQDFKGKGYCIEAEPNKTVLLTSPFRGTEGVNWLTLTPSDMNIKRVTFTHTGKSYRIETQNFISISADSLNSLVQNKHMTELEVISNATARKTEGGISEDFRTFKKSYLSTIQFEAKDSLVKSDSFYFLRSNTRALKENQIGILRAEYDLKRKRYDSAQSEIAILQRDTTRDYITRERIMKRIDELKRIVLTDYDFELVQLQIQKLQNEILIEEQQENMRYQIEYSKYLQNQSETLRGVTKTQFSGMVRYVEFN